ncbi:MAG TPA: hypothetical protein VKT82_26690 [Ktedonobacterales bacterium]|nr:hypothetical protein [Ktedonobacterales bacterium]
MRDEEPVNFEEVARLQNLDEQIDQRLYANPQARPANQDALDPQLLNDLRDFYQPHGQAFQQGLDRVWGRLEQSGAAQRQRPPRGDPTAEPGAPQERIHPMPENIRPGWGARLAALIAAVVAVVLVAGLVLGLVLVRANGTNTTGNNQTQTGSSPQATQTTSAQTPFSVTSVDLAVSPTSIAGKACGTSASFTYTATFHIPAGTAGGTIHFQYTLNNGMSSTSASVAVGAGQTSKTYTFTSSGTLPPDHTYPGIAEVLVTAPNSVHSPQVKPSGLCVAQAAFQVTSVNMAVSPTSIAGLACGTQVTVTYTATFHILANGPGGTIHFSYTVDNGRGSPPASITVAAGQTTATYSFTWSGALPPDHTMPENGGVFVNSPNQVNSPLVAPAGRCS